MQQEKIIQKSDSKVEYLEKTRKFLLDSLKFHGFGKVDGTLFNRWPRREF